MSRELVPLLLLLLSIHSALALKICSFNVRSFGESKQEDQNAMDVIVKVIKRCDIILVMEIKDNNNRIGPTLMQKLNGNSRRGMKYNYVISPRLGRNTYKEQYAFLYKEKLVSVKRTYQYHDYQDGDADVFSREPFVVWFQSPYTVVKDFVIIPLHTTPETSVKEIDELVDVYNDMKQRWKTENFIFMGDFNAGCSYVPKKAWKNIRLRIDPSFMWLIGDQEDTTVKKSTSCAYDRIVLRGQEIVSAVVSKSASVFDFQKAYKLSEEKALDVSDHFPVEFKLQSSRAFTNSKKSITPRKRTKSKHS
ncbi:deoxyribonuclease gamma [Saimiri boliviensis]|uniref:deoxyribonuclease gamma n=1 Tax=Saimiri boliviensis TaxID=27679 RepID=UPI00193D790A|nr:deoxyribonuclease gamma [Saimiri boliviensis boliviensis]